MSSTGGFLFYFHHSSKAAGSHSGWSSGLLWNPATHLGRSSRLLCDGTMKAWGVEKQFVHTGLETNTVAKSHLGKPANSFQRLEFKMRFTVGGAKGASR